MSEVKTGDYMNKLLSGEMTPVEFREYVIQNVDPKISKEEEAEKRRNSETFKAICKIEDIIPTEDQEKDSELYITGRLMDDEYRTFLKYRYGVQND